MKKNIIITGATSFIGVNLIDELIKHNYNITAIIRTCSSNKNRLSTFNGIKIVALEMHQYKEINKHVKYINDSILINLAWNGTRGIERDDEELQRANYEFSMDIVKAVVDSGCKMVINAGSQAEYGQHIGLISEETDCNPVTEYGIYKLKFFNEASSYCKSNNISFLELRFFSLYGVDDSKNTMILSILDSMIKNKKCELTECIQKWNFLHIRDAVRGIINLIEDKCNSGAYNFGSLDTRSLKSFIEEMYVLSGSKSEIIYGAIEYPKTGKLELCPDVTKLINTGWKPEISFKDGVSEIIERMRKGEI